MSQLFRLVSVLFRVSPKDTVWLIVLSVFSSVAYSAVMPILSSLVVEVSNGSSDVRGEYFVVFFMLTLVVLSLKYISEVVSMGLSLSLRLFLRKRFYRTLEGARLEGVESVGYPKLIQTVSVDIDNIVQGAMTFPRIVTNALVVFLLSAYIFYLSISWGMVYIATFLFGSIIYSYILAKSEKYYRRSRECRDEMQEGFEGYIFGFKELCLNNERRKLYLNRRLVEAENRVRQHEREGGRLQILATSFSEQIPFWVIGGAALLVYFSSAGAPALVELLTVVVYMIGSFAILLYQFPIVVVSSVSIRKHDSIVAELGKYREDTSIVEKKGNEDIYEIELERVTYQYPNGSGVASVSLRESGPAIIFIVGGNGAGKSTLAKLMSLHYLPKAGRLYVNGNEVSERNISQFREGVSCVYSDAHVFKDIMLTDGLSISEASMWLSYFNLSNAVRVEDGQFVYEGLSSGQKKRLALIVAILEKRRYLVLDEWASEQDPFFRKKFYSEILPRLKEMGFLVVAITHDDNYFDAADKVYRLDSGQLVNRAEIQCNP